MSARSGYFKPSGKTVKSRKVVSDEIGTPKFIYHPPNLDWKVVITSTGRKFFYNDKTKQSEWQVEDDVVNEQLDNMNKDEILLLIGKARGLIVREKKEKKTEKLHAERKIGQERKVEIEKKEPEEESTIPASSVNTLGLEYSDSESDTDPESDEAKSIDNSENKSGSISDSQSVSSEEGNGIDISDLSDLGSLDEDSATNEESRLVFRTLLDDAQLDPFSSWEIEAEKIVRDPRYLELDTDKERSSVFHQWSRDKIVEKNAQPAEVKIFDDVYQSFAQFVREKLIITKASKSVLKKLYFAEFKRKYRKDPSYQHFLQQLPEKEMELFYRQLISFEEKTINFPQESKRKLLLDLTFNSASLRAKVKQFIKANGDTDIFDQLKDQSPQYIYAQLLNNFQLTDQFLAKNIVPLHALSNQNQLSFKASILLEALQLQAQNLKR